LALNLGLWDYIFSFIKKRSAVLPDRKDVPSMDAYVHPDLPQLPIVIHGFFSPF